MAKHARYSHAGVSGPDYPTLGATVAKWRWRAREGLQSLAREERQAYGAAVERAILALQRAEANRGLPPISPKVHCASGTPHNTGEASCHGSPRSFAAARVNAGFTHYLPRSQGRPSATR